MTNPSTASPTGRIKTGVTAVYAALDTLSPVSILALRLWVATVFFKSGWLKLMSWDTTLYLFENEYAVPLLPADIAAMFGTGIELIFPVLLALGLAGRFAAIALFLFNIMAVISYPDLNAAGVRDHQVWGLMLLVPMLMGPGKLSIDYVLQKRLS
jgi:putative oxidoreductase